MKRRKIMNKQIKKLVRENKLFKLVDAMHYRKIKKYDAMHPWKLPF